MAAVGSEPLDDPESSSEHAATPTSATASSAAAHRFHAPTNTERSVEPVQLHRIAPQDRYLRALLFGEFAHVVECDVTRSEYRHVGCGKAVSKRMLSSPMACGSRVGRRRWHRLQQYLARCGHQVIAVDSSPDMLYDAAGRSATPRTARSSGRVQRDYRTVADIIDPAVPDAVRRLIRRSFPGPPPRAPVRAGEECRPGSSHVAGPIRVRGREATSWTKSSYIWSKRRHRRADRQAVEHPHA